MSVLGVHLLNTNYMGYDRFSYHFLSLYIPSGPGFSFECLETEKDADKQNDNPGPPWALNPLMATWFHVVGLFVLTIHYRFIHRWYDLEEKLKQNILDGLFKALFCILFGLPVIFHIFGNWVPLIMVIWMTFGLYGIFLISTIIIVQLTKNI